MLSAQPFSTLFSRFALVGGLALVLASCSDDPEEAGPLYNISKDGNNVFVLNEGKFQTPNGAVSYFSKGTKTVVDKSIFQTVNQRELGDVVQSMLVVGNQGYIVANNSKKMEVVNLTTFKTIATINNLEQPRYAVAAGTNKAYITEWVKYGSPGRVSVLDLNTNTVLKTIAVGKQPEQIVAVNGKVYVANSGENNLSVINPATDAVESTITVPDGPSSLVVDKTNAIWVLGAGFTVYDSNPPYPVLSSTPGSLTKINPTTNTVQSSLAFASNNPGGLRIDGTGTQLYYRYKGAIYRMSTSDVTLPATPLIRRSFSGLDIDPKDNTIYAAVTPSYTTSGKFIRYQGTGSATAIDSFEVNIGPNGFIFY
ncbi:YncE family protein [Hymenobacter cellulosivorans]|uniref:YncE family protein n=1 Tax=Hymenobacter cellulosivorans TaxID=2932249 RepID=A0ABY4FBJ7_9BACT|nr:YncE family protein [Hymenobacter cellulosivorans]UOQ53388.1 YncE family protein [Hymenobacter cellulosivorans]